MNISLKWLNNYVDIPKELSVEELAEKITMSIVEVDSFVKQSDNLENIIVARVKEINDHPNADKLKVCQVDAGKRGNFTVVCGGNNLRKNMFVAFALVDSKIKWHGEGDLISLEKTKIRGVESEGMIASAEEIGLPEEYIVQGGITDLQLDKSFIGKDISEALKLDDVILEIDNKSLTNRPDLWGHYGIARELSALLNTRFKNLVFPLKLRSKSRYRLDIRVKDKKTCRRYLGVILDNIKVAPSPKWMSRALEKIGVRSINNIVDVTNFVMMELGQPLHAFDLKNINDHRIIVKKANDGDKFTTLDEEERKLTKYDLLICDSKKPIALAGIMGGLNSQISDNTKTILIESANFEPVGIRRTSMRTGLRTDSSSRFEKDLDPNLAKDAIMRAIELVQQLNMESIIASRLIDKNFSRTKEIKINLNLDFLNKKIGQDLPRKTVIDILKRLNFTVKDKKKELEVGVPSYRAGDDITIPEDLVEEIARIYGYDNIKPEEPNVALKSSFKDKVIIVERILKDLISQGLGYSEVYNYSMISENDIKKAGEKKSDYFEIVNPVTKNLKYLRNSLIINLLKNVVDNLRYFKEFKIFETGRVFIKKNGDFKMKKDFKGFLPSQDKILGMIMADQDNNFLSIKGDIESVLNKLGIDYKSSILDNISLIKGRALEYYVNEQSIGFIGEINNRILNNFDIETRIFYGELNISKSLKYIKEIRKYKPLSKYPKMIQDISMLIPYSVRWQDIEKKINAVSPLITDVELFDIYEGKDIEKSKRSLAFHITFHNPTKTLTSNEVDRLMKQVKEMLVKEFGVKIRD